MQDATARADATRSFTRLSFTPVERLQLAGAGASVVLLHGFGWGLFLYYSARYPSLIGLGLVACLFGLRHAFDVDHIAAVDDTVRFMLQKGRQPLTVGFFFSLGHATVVFALAAAIIVAAAAVKQGLPVLQDIGGLIGAGVSGTFLWLIGILNLLVLLDMLKIWRRARQGRHDHAHLEQLLARRGFINRLLGNRLQRTINHGWQMYPVGLLFGLGFDTASEVGLLAMTAASAATLPAPAILSLPILFAAGMTAMDTTDGILMTKAYNWAFVNPLRKIFYNITTTTLSIVAALAIGSIELLRLLAGALHLHGSFFRFFAELEIASLGYLIAGLLLLAWGGSVALWKFARIEERYGPEPVAHRHEHTHPDGVRHSHQHFH